MNSYFATVVGFGVNDERIAPRALSRQSVDEDKVTLRLSGDRTVYLDRKDNRFNTFSRILQAAQTNQDKIFVKTQEESQDLSELLIPHSEIVVSITPSDQDGAFDVQLMGWPRPCKLVRENNGRFKEILKALKHAEASKKRIQIVESLDLEPLIEDVNVEEEQPLGNDFPTPTDPTDFVAEHHRPISKYEAKSLFNLVISPPQSSSSFPAIDIPFNFASTGCVPRAHEMCRRIISEGKIQPMKIWVFAFPQFLKVKTTQSPTCEYVWSFHVAPLILTEAGLFVIDPALFENIVPHHEWLSELGDSIQGITHTSADVNLITQDRAVFVADPDYSKAHESLRKLNHNADLFFLEHGHPPYKECIEYV